jgi:hypothetical protein
MLLLTCLPKAVTKWQLSTVRKKARRALQHCLGRAAGTDLRRIPAKYEDLIVFEPAGSGRSDLKPTF